MGLQADITFAISSYKLSSIPIYRAILEQISNETIRQMHRDEQSGPAEAMRDPLRCSDSNLGIDIVGGPTAGQTAAILQCRLAIQEG